MRKLRVALGCRLLGLPSQRWPHFFLEHVFEHRRELVRECGFHELEGRTPYGMRVVWASPATFRGPLAHVPREGIERWLLAHGVAGQIHVSKMWGAGPE